MFKKKGTTERDIYCPLQCPQKYSVTNLKSYGPLLWCHFWSYTASVSVHFHSVENSNMDILHFFFPLSCSTEKESQTNIFG